MRQNKNKALSFDARVTMKERSITRCLKRACNSGWSSNQVDIVR